MIFIFALGTIKLVRGLILDKPVGILILILLIQGAAIILLDQEQNLIDISNKTSVYSFSNKPKATVIHCNPFILG